MNTNAFGGVWSTSVLCHLAESGCLDIACKFNTRSYYGLIENGPGRSFYRLPVSAKLGAARADNREL